MQPSRAEIILAYRQIYKHLLRAVLYATPARYIAQDRIRNAFRNSDPSEYDATRVARTVEFLDGAAKSKGLEHRIVKNLMHVWWEQKMKVPYARVRENDRPFRKIAYDDFNRTIGKLNETMGSPRYMVGAFRRTPTQAKKLAPEKPNEEPNATAGSNDAQARMYTQHLFVPLPPSHSITLIPTTIVHLGRGLWEASMVTFSMLKLFGTLALVTVVLVVALRLHLEYLSYLALGPGGTPSTVFGFTKVTMLSFLAIKNPYIPHSTKLQTDFALGYLSVLPVRGRERPLVRGIAPHRQVSQMASATTFEKLQCVLGQIAEASATITLGTSCFESLGTALFVGAQTKQNEICHVHNSDGSMHMVLSRPDADLVLANGWGERHPLSRGGWFERFVPAEFMMVYAPQNDADVETVARIVQAASAYVEMENMDRRKRD